MHRRTALFVGFFLLALAAFAAYGAWAIHAAAGIDRGWAGLGTAWPYLLAGALTAGGGLAIFVWLAFFSERRGFDDRANPRGQ